MTEPCIVTPKQAQEWSRKGSWPLPALRRLSDTVATEPDRTRAAVIAALRQTADSLSRSGYPSSCYFMRARADAIENGADW